jgi:hypothetical protein
MYTGPVDFIISFCICKLNTSWIRLQTELDHKPKEDDSTLCAMLRLIVTAGFVISIVTLFLIFVKDVEGTQDDNEITLTVLFNEIVTSPNAG